MSLDLTRGVTPKVTEELQPRHWLRWVLQRYCCDYQPTLSICCNWRLPRNDQNTCCADSGRYCVFTPARDFSSFLTTATYFYLWLLTITSSPSYPITSPVECPRVVRGTSWNFIITGVHFGATTLTVVTQTYCPALTFCVYFLISTCLWIRLLSFMNNYFQTQGEGSSHQKVVSSIIGRTRMDINMYFYSQPCDISYHRWHGGMFCGMDNSVKAPRFAVLWYASSVTFFTSNCIWCFQFDDVLSSVLLSRLLSSPCTLPGNQAATSSFTAHHQIALQRPRFRAWLFMRAP